MAVYFLRGEPGNFTEISAAADQRAGLSMEQAGSGQSVTIGGIRCAPRPYDVRKWNTWLNRSWIHQTCVDAKAEDIVGSGYTLSEDVPESTRKEIEAVVNRSIDNLMDACRDDEGTGFMGLECQPTVGGRELYQLNQIDSWTLWRSIEAGPGKQGVIHKRGQKATRFAPLGQFEKDANMLAFKNCRHWYDSTWYGVPDIVPVLIQMEAAWAAYQHNYDFFVRGAGYQWLMLIEGGMQKIMSEEGVTDQTLIKEINYATKEAGKTSSGDILSIPIGNRKVVMHKLSADMKDMDYAGMLGLFTKEIRACHRVAPARLGMAETGAMGGTASAVEMLAYKKVIDAKQRSWNTLMNEVIGVWWPGVDAGFTFNPIDIDEFALLAPHVANVFKSMLISRDEARGKLKLPPIDNGVDMFADEFEMAGSFGPGGISAEEEEAKA